MEERRGELRAERDALTWVLKELAIQRQLQKIARQELGRQMRERKWTRDQGREMQRAINEAWKLADQTERKTIGILREVMAELRALEE